MLLYEWDYILKLFNSFLHTLVQTACSTPFLLRSDRVINPNQARLACVAGGFVGERAREREFRKNSLSGMGISRGLAVRSRAHSPTKPPATQAWNVAISFPESAILLVYAKDLETRGLC